MRSLIVVAVRLSGLIWNPNHGNACRIANPADASTVANTTAMPAMADQDAAGGIHAASQAGTEPCKDASSANHPNRDAKPLMMSGPTVSGSNRMPTTLERVLDALAIGEEEIGAEIERNARLEQQGDDTEQDRVAEGIAENVHAADARRRRHRRSLGLRKRSGARHVLQHSGAPLRRVGRGTVHQDGGAGEAAPVWRSEGDLCSTIACTGSNGTLVVGQGRGGSCGGGGFRRAPALLHALIIRELPTPDAVEILIQL
ncbi:hypothetical protein ACVW0J_006357 [Bradyrhizobium sp. i1.7.7]